VVVGFYGFFDGYAVIRLYGHAVVGFYVFLTVIRLLGFTFFFTVMRLCGYEGDTVVRVTGLYGHTVIRS
jgi:hypothetical protein